MCKKMIKDVKNIARLCCVVTCLYGSQSFGQTFEGGGGGLAPLGTTSGVVTYQTNVLGVSGSFVPGKNVPAILGYNTQITNITLDNVEHSFASDLDLRLISPGGTRYSFNLDNGGSTGLEIASDMIFDLAAANCADTWTSSASASQPEDGLLFETAENQCGPIDSTISYSSYTCGMNASGIDGDLINGDWTLEITDDAGGDTGTFDRFTITFAGMTPPEIDSNGLAIDRCVIDTFPYSQNFDAMSPCAESLGDACLLTPSDGWFNDDANADDLDWTVDVDGTSSTPTGPSADHSIGDATGRYLYIESSTSGTGYPLKTAHIESPFFNFIGRSPVLTFWYHMFGSSQGTMHFDVDPLGDGNWVNDVIPEWTDNQDIWQQQQIDLGQWAGNDTFRFRIRGITGSSFRSDMAVDDFVIEDDGFCVPIIAQTGSIAVVCF